MKMTICKIQESEKSAMGIGLQLLIQQMSAFRQCYEHTLTYLTHPSVVTFAPKTKDTTHQRHTDRHTPHGIKPNCYHICQ